MWLITRLIHDLIHRVVSFAELHMHRYNDLHAYSFIFVYVGTFVSLWFDFIKCIKCSGSQLDCFCLYEYVMRLFRLLTDLDDSFLMMYHFNFKKLFSLKEENNFTPISLVDSNKTGMNPIQIKCYIFQDLMMELAAFGVVLFIY